MSFLPAILSLGLLFSPQADDPALTRSQSALDAARRERDPVRRLELFAEAERTLHAALDAGPDPRLAQAHLALAPAYVADLEQALELAEPARRNELRATLDALLARALAHSAPLAAPAGPELTPTERLQRWRATLARAQLLLAFGRTSAAPAAPLDEARAALERVRAEAGADSAPDWSARLALAQVLRARGELERSAEHARAVLTRALPEDPAAAEWQALPPAARAERFRLAELACPELVLSQTDLGQHAEAARWALFFLDASEREGFTLSAFGELARLAAHRALTAARGYVVGMPAHGRRWHLDEQRILVVGMRHVDELALEAVEELRARQPGTILAARARALGLEILRRGDARALPASRLAFAREELAAGDFAAALALLEPVLVQAGSGAPAERHACFPSVWAALGDAHAGLGHGRQAALAFREAATDEHAEAELRARAAEAFYRQASALAERAPDDAESAALAREAEALAAELVPGALGQTLRWLRAERAFAQQDFGAARALYLAVSSEASEFETARVKAALSLEKQGDAAGAARELAACLDAQQEAQGLTRFSLARLRAAQGDSRAVLELLEGFAQRFPAERELVAGALALLVEAHLARGELDAARAAEAELARDFALHPARARAALALYRALADELAAAENGEEHERARGLALERAGHLASANRAARTPSFVNLQLEAELWSALERPAESAAALRELLAAFAGDAAHAAELAGSIRPRLAHAELALGRTEEAFATLAELVPRTPADARRPPAEVVRDWCRAVTGWLEGSAPPFTTVPGARAAAGLEARAAELLGELIEAEKARGQAWGCAGFALELERAYALHAAARRDAGQRARLERVLADIVARLGGPELAELARYGCDPGLRLRFLVLTAELGAAVPRR